MRTSALFASLVALMSEVRILQHAGGVLFPQHIPLRLGRHRSALLGVALGAEAVALAHDIPDGIHRRRIEIRRLIRASASALRDREACG
jgi:hypothetical protein